MRMVSWALFLVVMMLIVVNFRMLSMMVRAPWMRELMMGSSAEIAREKVSKRPTHD